jgi:ABC-2 type transport system ATP-binding protein
MISFDGLTKLYGTFTAVDNVSFTCPEGIVTGFLGPNGAGKSTTLRMLVGLTTPTSGRVTVGGRAYRELANPGREIGVLLDASAQHAGRTGREILTLGALTMGVPLGRVEEMIHLVGLTQKEAGRRVHNYSLGMRQRLGIAHALLGDPSILVLDEPANGLDPAGMAWMRGLLRGFAGRGGTVLLSSHLLGEVEATADVLVLIGKGRVLAKGTKNELVRPAGTAVRATQPSRLAVALTSAGHAVTPHGADGLRTSAEVAQVSRIAFEVGVTLLALGPATENSLEKLFFELTAESAREEVAA